MECKGKTEAQCRSGNSCQWVNAATPYCRRRSARAGGQPAVSGLEASFNNMTLRELKLQPVYKKIEGRSSMNKAILLARMKAVIKEQARQQARAARETEQWPTKCKVLEKKCPMSTTLVGDDWCEVDERDVIYTKIYDACFEHTELLRVIHEGFVAQDTSYQVPQLRLKLPRDPVRQFIRKKVMKQLLLNREAFDAHVAYLTKHQELLYFFVHLDDFYKTFDKPAYKSLNINSVKLSKDIENWQLKYKSPAGGLRLRRHNDRQDVEWRFKREDLLKSYQLHDNGKLQVLMYR